MKGRITTTASGDPELVDPLEQLTQTDGEAFANWVLGYDPTSGTNIQEMTISIPDDTSIPSLLAYAGLVQVNNGAKFLVSKIVALAQSGNLVGKDLPHAVFANAFEASYTGGVLSYTRLGGIDVDFSMTNNGYATPATLTTSLPDGTTPPTTITLGDSVGLTILSISTTSPGPWIISTDIGIGTHEAKTFRVCPGFSANQYINTGDIFGDFCLEVLNENGTGVSDVTIDSGNFFNDLIGDLSGTNKTDSNGRLFIRFTEIWAALGFTGSEGALYTFKIDDPDILSTIDTIIDEGGNTSDRNLVPFIHDYDLPGYPAGKELRSRLVRVEKDNRPIIINLSMTTGAETKVNEIKNLLIVRGQAGANQYTKGNILAQTKTKIESIFLSSGITVSVRLNEAKSPDRFEAVIAKGSELLYTTLGMQSKVYFDPLTDRNVDFAANIAFFWIANRFNPADELLMSA